ncbi:Uncharacterised protein [Mycoplasmopsis californica]|uniref:DUF3899 domain-containing protein n=1 Tax=Mycoplasmopsis equigenitalium TaxID=114883 RepID=A0ABY5J1E6_9BACT|nr:hypothetical protein [Mycoplasmopsis equigenitalium]UUD36810.1 hypothetical protein NPA09_02845 [Mycoplasmopsis equigenitalium]VEU69892.1 Uncharacterised protein [Mycoplasmopsis californica]
MNSRLTFTEYLRANMTWSNLIKFLVFQAFSTALFLLSWFFGPKNEKRIGDALTIVSFVDLGIMLIIAIFKLGFMANIIAKIKINNKEKQERFNKKYGAPSPEELKLLEKEQPKQKEKYKSNFVFYILLVESLLLVIAALILSFA